MKRLGIKGMALLMFLALGSMAALPEKASAAVVTPSEICLTGDNTDDTFRLLLLGEGVTGDGNIIVTGTFMRASGTHEGTHPVFGSGFISGSDYIIGLMYVYSDNGNFGSIMLNLDTTTLDGTRESYSNDVTKKAEDVTSFECDPTP